MNLAYRHFLMVFGLLKPILALFSAETYRFDSYGPDKIGCLVILSREIEIATEINKIDSNFAGRAAS